MNNRNLSLPILFASVLLLIIGLPRLSQAESDASVNDPAAAPVPAPPLAYTVVRGDTLFSIAHKFGMTLKQLKRLNNLSTAKVSVKPGQVLQVISVNGTPGIKSATAAHRHKKKTPSSYVMAQPVQDFDLTGSTSEPRTVSPSSHEDDADASASVEPSRHAPVAKLVSPAELSADQPQEKTAPPAVAPAPEETESVAPSEFSSKHVARALPVDSGAAVTASPSAYNPPAVKLTSRTPLTNGGSNPFYTPAATDWGSRFLLQARLLGDRGIEYDEDWRPPGEPRSWPMDCSNTARYLYRVTTGIELPRTASDQYYYLHLQGKAWDVPENAYGLADTEFLRRNLKPGDLLFWENTYRPERQPPITHVMIFLGTNANGQWIMAGSQTSSGGEHNRRNGGPDIYVFRPSQPCGGYTTWLGFVHHRGRFCAFGRPLEADRSKLTVATD